jgi:hypothetical protein
MRPVTSCLACALVLGLLSGCSAQSTPPAISTSTPSPLPTQTAAPTITIEPQLPLPTPNLTSRPLVWFAPSPPLDITPWRPYLGSEDFIRLFTEDAEWAEAAARVQVFKLYGEWVAWHATDDELRQVVSDLNRRGIAIAAEGGPLEPDSTCGQGIEGFAGIEEALRIARRIRDAGGMLRFFAFDEPFAMASLYEGPNACRWPAERVALEVTGFVETMRTEFPDVVFGDNEVLWSDRPVDELEGWIDAYETVAGEPLGFFHLDLDYTRPDWPQAARELEVYARDRGVDFGIMYLGDLHARTDEAWLSAAGERVITYETVAGGHADHILFQSWHDHPDRVLPETEAYTFSWFINAYFGDRSALGFRTEGPRANLAIGRQVRVSRVLAGSDMQAAVDGNPETWWASGAPAPQWIEVDLGSPRSIAEVNLWVSQYPPGATTHRVLVKGPGTDNQYLVLYTFTGATTDLDLLSVPMQSPLDGIRFVRVETTESPSWVSWREVEVIASE